MKNILFLFVSLLFAACTKDSPTATTPDDTPIIADMIIKSVNGYKSEGDSASKCMKYIGYYFANNEIHIVGNNFGEDDGEIATTHPSIKVSLLSWDDTEIVVYTNIDSYLTEISTPLSISIKRADGKTIETEKLNVVNDIENFPQFTPTWYIYSVLQAQSDALPNDFYQNMDECDGGYEPQLYDIVTMPNGVTGIVTDTPRRASNGSYSEHTFTVSYMDCNAQKSSVTAKFKVVSDEVTVSNVTPVKYFRV
jgi:hypothetical protein